MVSDKITHSVELEPINTVSRDPQLLGLIDADARLAAASDSRSLLGESGLPLIVPIEYNTEANQDYFEHAQGYFVDWYTLAEKPDSDTIRDYLKQLPAGAKLMFELREGDAKAFETFQGYLHADGRSMALDEAALDTEDGSIAAVRHYISPNQKAHDARAEITSLKDAYKLLVETGEWEEFRAQGVDYKNGSVISDDLLEKLWQVYDKTFDKLVENHPSAQKQPREYFEQQLLLPESGAIFVETGDRVSSALFLVEDVKVCPWLDAEFYDRINPHGKTVFISCVSTDLNLSGMHLSQLTMGATGRLGSLVPSLTATATQCTNRSSKYIPRLSAAFTKESVQLDFQEIAAYVYPVYVLS